MTDDKLSKIQAILEEARREAYQKGWNDAVKKILAAAQEGTPLVQQPAPTAQKPPSHQPDIPIIKMVDQIVHERPGLRGNEIVQEIRNRDPRIAAKVADRTGRTSLSRLEKRDRKIVNRDGRWYPAGSQSNQKEPAIVPLALSEPGAR